MGSHRLFFILISLFFSIVLVAPRSARAEGSEPKTVTVTVSLPIEQKLLEVVIVDDGQERTPWFLMRLFKPWETPVISVFDDGPTVLIVSESLSDGPVWGTGDGKHYGLPFNRKLVSVSWNCDGGQCLPQFETRPMRRGEKAEQYSFADGQTWHLILERRR